MKPVAVCNKFMHDKKSAYHHKAVEVMISLPSITHDIHEQLSQQHAAQKLRNSKALYQILSSIKFLCTESTASVRILCQTRWTVCAETMKKIIVNYKTLGKKPSQHAMIQRPKPGSRVLEHK